MSVKNIKAVVMTYFKEVSQHLPEEVVENSRTAGLHLKIRSVKGRT
jgi:hypothetical protein